jgi:hypothetical protein
MEIQEQIKKYIDSQPDLKRADFETLHYRLLQLLPKCRSWFLDGKDEKGKVITNPNNGYNCLRQFASLVSAGLNHKLEIYYYI